jgi:hypothetical protein
LREVEGVELVEQIRAVAAVDLVEVLAHGFRMPDAAWVVARLGGAAPGVALVVGEGRTVVHLGVVEAELQLGRFQHFPRPFTWVWSISPRM